MMNYSIDFDLHTSRASTATTTSTTPNKRFHSNSGIEFANALTLVKRNLTCWTASFAQSLSWTVLHLISQFELNTFRMNRPILESELETPRYIAARGTCMKCGKCAIPFPWTLQHFETNRFWQLKTSWAKM